MACVRIRLKLIAQEYAMGAPHQPDDQKRAQVRALAGFGIIQVDIANYLGIATNTLVKHYKKELEVGPVSANMKVASRLYDIAINGNDREAKIACMFWLKTRAGWKENNDFKGQINVNHSDRMEQFHNEAKVNSQVAEATQKALRALGIDLNPDNGDDEVPVLEGEIVHEEQADAEE